MKNEENCDYPATRIAEDPPDLIPMVSANAHAANAHVLCCEKCVLDLTQRCSSANVRCLSFERPNHEIIYFVYRKQKKGNDKK